MRSAKEIWEAALGDLELQVNKPNFRTWLEKSVGQDYKNNRFTVCVPNVFVAEYLNKNQRSLIEKTLIGLIGDGVEVSFKVASAPDQQARETIPPRRKAAHFNPKYTFDSFVVGGCNRLAHASAMASAKNPGKGYNPLFCYGGVGLGKTHLLQAIGNMALNRGLEALYVSGEQFTNDFIGAIKDKRTEDFRRKYRKTDILLFDDIHFIGGKSGTEECFFHTFNELHNSNRQIVISSDRPPKEIPFLEDRLCSRFEWGLVVETKAPDFKTRLAILRAKAEQSGTNITTATLEYIAHQAKRSVRELEGLLNRVVAYTLLLNTTASPDLARQAIANISERASQNGRLSAPMLIETVAKSFSLSSADIIGRRRDKETALARQVVMYLLKQQNNCSLTEIGLELGGRSPSTVSYACEKIGADIESSSYVRHKLDDINSSLHARPL
jgi:chromosomal replication initiator protein